jgi:hypothetical protein
MSNVSEAAIMLFHATFLQRRKEFQVVNTKNPWIQCGPKKVFLGCPMRDFHICNLHDENIYVSSFPKEKAPAVESIAFGHHQKTSLHIFSEKFSI